MSNDPPPPAFGACLAVLTLVGVGVGAGLVVVFAFLIWDWGIASDAMPVALRVGGVLGAGAGVVFETIAAAERKEKKK